jgi:hypothetical protein
VAHPFWWSIRLGEAGTILVSKELVLFTTAKLPQCLLAGRLEYNGSEDSNYSKKHQKTP